MQFLKIKYIKTCEYVDVKDTLVNLKAETTRNKAVFEKVNGQSPQESLESLHSCLAESAVTGLLSLWCHLV